jgi:hypothetical protein
MTCAAERIVIVDLYGSAIRLPRHSYPLAAAETMQPRGGVGLVMPGDNIEIYIDLSQPITMERE